MARVYKSRWIGLGFMMEECYRGTIYFRFSLHEQDARTSPAIDWKLNEDVDIYIGRYIPHILRHWVGLLYPDRLGTEFFEWKKGQPANSVDRSVILETDWTALTAKFNRLARSADPLCLSGDAPWESHTLAYTAQPLLA